MQAPSAPSQNNSAPSNGTPADDLGEGSAMTLAHEVEPERAFEPRNYRQAFKLAEMLVRSGLLPRTIATPEAALAIMVTGRELGLTMMQSMRSIVVIEGKPTLSADLMVALVKRSPDCEYFIIVSTSTEKCEIRTKRRSEPEAQTFTWTIQDAERANLLRKDNWKCYPRAMLRARCAAEASRAVYPHRMMGIYLSDEIGDHIDMVQEGPSGPPASVYAPREVTVVKETTVVPEVAADRSARKTSGVAARVAAKNESAKGAPPPPKSDPSPPQPVVVPDLEERDPMTGELVPPERP